MEKQRIQVIRELGVNANSNLIKALYKLDSLSLPASHLLGKTTVNIGKMSGGVAANVIPAEAMAQVSVRIAADTIELIKQLIGDALEGMDGIEVKWKDPAYSMYSNFQYSECLVWHSSYM